MLERLVRFVYSETGDERCRTLPFLSDPEVLRRELERVTEMRDLLSYDDPLPLRRFPNLLPTLKKSSVSGAFLNGRELLDVQDLLSLSRQILCYMEPRREKAPLVWEHALCLVPVEPLEREILSAIEPSGEVADHASPALAKIRKDIARRKEHLRQRLEAILRSMVKAGFAKEEQLAFREGRLVVPMKDTYQSRLKGVILDQSASGQTVFMEPIEALEMNNELRRLHIQENQEIERILRHLTETVSRHGETITRNQEILSVLDCVHARARHSLSIQCNAARISTDGMLQIKDARHPILLSRLPGTEVVPLSLCMGGDLKTVVITGPNAGGKTVALKTIGLLAVMHQHGLHVPAAEGTSMPVFTGVYADIGDRQSIEHDLSTFSSHIQNLKEILALADHDSLVLLDEIGSATDPAEGGALAVSILRHLTRSGCLSVATTHIGMLKVFAHSETGVENGSMVFDQKTLKPTYRFQLGLPGSSYAFEIAEKLGFPAGVVQEARASMGEERGRLDRLIYDLEEHLRKAETLHREASTQSSRHAGLVRLYESKIAELEQEAGEHKRRLVEEAETVLREVNLMKERVVRELRENKASPEAVRQSQQEIREKRELLAALAVSPAAEPKSLSTAMREGDWVSWRGHAGSGRILSKPDRKGRVMVEWNDVRLRVPEQELIPATAPAKASGQSGLVHVEAERLSDNELDLRGRTAEEAINALERFLPDAVAAGFSNARIIHGKGTGVLRREVGKYLDGHRLVKNARPGAWNEGDTGVTIVEFK